MTTAVPLAACSISVSGAKYAAVQTVFTVFVMGMAKEGYTLTSFGQKAVLCTDSNVKYSGVVYWAIQYDDVFGMWYREVGPILRICICGIS